MSFFHVELDREEVQENIDRLIEFCSRHSWTVVFSNKKNSRYHNKVVTLFAKRKLEILYYVFLHEIGHAWMLECDVTYQDRYPELVRSPLRYATVTYKIAKVQEEIEAWEVGKKIAKSLGLRINKIKFEKIRAECLATYMNWAVKSRKGRESKYGKTTTSSSDTSDNTSGS